MDKIEYLGPRAPTEAERSQLDGLGYEQDIVLLEWRRVSDGMPAFVPFPRSVVEQDLASVLAESEPRVLKALGKTPYQN